MELIDIIYYSVPSVFLVTLIMIYYALKMYKISQIEQEYKMDKFRLDLESQIVKLSDQLTFNQERFEKMNHLLFTSQINAPLEKNNDIQQKPNAFLKRMGIDPDIKVEKDLIFVLMPFHPDFKETFEVIKKVSEESGFRCQRGDEEYFSRDILDHILELIVKSRLVIADISGRNANVLYELGIAHTLGKQVMIISKSMEDMPFDLSKIRMLTYKDSKDLKEKLRNWLMRTFARLDDS